MSATALLCSTRARSSRAAERASGGRKSRMRSRPRASALDTPVSSAALLFHSTIRPAASVPKIGALAMSMKVCSSRADRSFSPSTRFRSVISCPTPMVPTIAPLSSRREDALSSISTRWPFRVLIGMSKLAVSYPASAPASTSLTRSLSSSGINSCRRSACQDSTQRRQEGKGRKARCSQCQGGETS